jgi:hypothetical protein
MIRWTFNGVIKEGMLGIPPSSEPVNITGIGIFRITTYAKLRSCGSNLMLGLDHNTPIPFFMNPCNIIMRSLQAGGNYGWPYLSGYKDNKAYQYYNWSAAENCKQLKFNDVAPAPPGVPVRNESEFNAPNFVPPLQTFYTVESDYNFTE